MMGFGITIARRRAAGPRHSRLAWVCITIAVAPPLSHRKARFHPPLAFCIRGLLRSDTITRRRLPKQASNVSTLILVRNESVISGTSRSST